MKFSSSVQDEWWTCFTTYVTLNSRINTHKWVHWLSLTVFECKANQTTWEWTRPACFNRLGNGAEMNLDAVSWRNRQKAESCEPFRFPLLFRLEKNWKKTTNLASGRGVVWFRRIFCQCRDTPLNIRRRRYWRPWRPGFGTLAVPKWTNLNLQNTSRCRLIGPAETQGHTHTDRSPDVHGVLSRVFLAASPNDVTWRK